MGGVSISEQIIVWCGWISKTLRWREKELSGQHDQLPPYVVKGSIPPCPFLLSFPGTVLLCCPVQCWHLTDLLESRLSQFWSIPVKFIFLNIIFKKCLFSANKSPVILHLFSQLESKNQCILFSHFSMHAFSISVWLIFFLWCTLLPIPVNSF